MGLLGWLAKGAVLASPSASLGALELLVRLGWQPPSRVSREQLAALFQDLTPSEIALVSRCAGWLEAKDRALGFLARARGAAALDRYVTFASGGALLDSEAPRGAAILGTWHAGIPALASIAAARLGRRVLVLRAEPRGFAIPNVEEFVVRRRPERRAMALKAAVDHLRAGGLVMLALDGPGSAATLPCLGRRLRISRGALALARWTGAPLVPVIASGAAPGPAVQLLFGPPIVVEQGALHDAPARWFEGFLRRHPEQLRWDLARQLLARPPDQAGSRADPKQSAASRRSSS